MRALELLSGSSEGIEAAATAESRRAGGGSEKIRAETQCTTEDAGRGGWGKGEGACLG
jgi:hypothetical protein